MDDRHSCPLGCCRDHEVDDLHASLVSRARDGEPAVHLERTLPIRWQRGDLSKRSESSSVAIVFAKRSCAVEVLERDGLRHGDLVVNSGRREVLVGDDEIQLAPKEFDLLWELLDHRGIVLTRDQLLERVWGYTFAGDTRTVDVHVRQIRRKLGDASPIVTVWGVGYKVATERNPAPAA